MAKENSFDIVSKIDRQEVKNAVDQSVREIENRFDFRGVTAEISLEEDGLTILAQDDMRLKNIKQVLQQKFIKRELDFSALEEKTEEAATKGAVRQRLVFREGIDKETGKTITTLIKSLNLKVKAQIQDEQVRVTSQSKDDLQAVIAAVKGADLDRPVQFVNFR